MLKILRDAAREDLIERSESGEQILLRPRFVDAMHTFFATMFLFLAHSVGEALDEMKAAAAQPGLRHAISHQINGSFRSWRLLSCS